MAAISRPGCFTWGNSGGIRVTRGGRQGEMRGTTWEESKFNGLKKGEKGKNNANKDHGVK